MSNRIRKMGRRWTQTLCVISFCGAVLSCTDDYELDDKTPSWVGKSIYEYLQSQGNYENFIKLIDDRGSDYVDVMKGTGSKTLFVANDSAFDAFYQDNIWGVTKYEDFTDAQKKLLLNSAMINNAYLMEMMSSTEGPEKGKCLRRETALDVTDSVPHLYAEDIPISYFEDKSQEKDYWARFREESKNGIYIALDNTSSMMTHFLAAQMSANSITDEDFKMVVGRERDKNDAFIYDSKVVEQDITCLNGYINRLDKVLIPPQNMAEVLRTNGDTKIFSHMIDRFSAPFYSATLTERYKLLYGNSVDSVFQKRYFSLRSQGNSELNNDAGTSSNSSGNEFSPQEDKLLQFDPGWNTYQTDDKTAKEEDMAIIFTPSDASLYNYFFSENGGGKFLIEAYAPTYIDAVQSATDYENIYKCIDQIPLDVISALLNNLMKDSFINSVPSKFDLVKNDAQDPMFTEDNINSIKEMILANNGVICIMDEVITPAKYAAVSAPAYVGTDMHIFKYAFSASTLGGTQTNFDAYLLAMSSRFSFFVPKDGSSEDDENFWYIDPASFKNSLGEQQILHYTWNGSTVRCTAYEYDYDYSTGIGTIGNAKTSSVSSTVWENRLKDMLETHTIVHEDQSDIYNFDETETGIECNKHYFLTKSGAPLYVSDATKRDAGCKVQGGWQNDRDEYCNVIRFDDKTAETNGNGNGMAYQIDTPLMPTIESVYSIMYNNQDKFGKFFELCQTDAEVLEALGIVEKNSSGENEQKKYMIFYGSDGLPCYDKSTNSLVASATNVRFFNNYRYTVYIPTNEAVEEAIANGLPTWEQLREELKLDEEGAELNLTDDEIAIYKAKISCIVNFVRYHFQDNSIFADTAPMSETSYETAGYDEDEETGTGTYYKLYVSSDGDNSITIKDLAGHERKTTSDKNLLARDYIISSNSISASSFAVIHGIDGVLNYKNYTTGNYSEDYSTVSAAKKYLSKYSVNQ